MRVGPQEIAEKLLLLAAHSALGLVLSGTLGIVLYMVMVPIVQSFWRVTDIQGRLKRLAPQAVYVWQLTRQR